MKILILGLNYLPESTSIGPYTADLAEYVQQRGHDVQVVTGFPSAPGWKVTDEYRGKRFMREVVRGVPVLRTYLYVPRNPRQTFRRVLFDSSFAISALAGALTGRPDIVMVISPPLQLAVTGWMLGTFYGAPVFLHLKDIVPDAAVAVGALRADGVALRLASVLEQFAYRKAAGIGVICEGMRQNLVAKGVPANKVVTLPDYIDPAFIRPQPVDLAFRARFGIGAGEFVAMYSGSVSQKQGLGTFVEAAQAFDHEEGVTCCLIGDGPNLPELKQTAQKRSIERFRFLPLQPRESLPSQFSAADVLVLTQRKAVRDVVFPGKLLYYMAAGRAILAAASTQSETARFIREHDAGLVVPPEEPGSLAEAIRWMRSHPEKTQEFGRNGRRVVERDFDRGVVLDRFAAHLEGGLTPCASQS